MEYKRRSPLWATQFAAGQAIVCHPRGVCQTGAANPGFRYRFTLGYNLTSLRDFSQPLKPVFHSCATVKATKMVNKKALCTCGGCQSYQSYDGFKDDAIIIIGIFHSSAVQPFCIG
jgi:hypothetical protein